MNSENFENLYIFVADTLRYDYIPENIKEEKSVIRTLAPSLHTPVSFSSLVTGRSPERHNVRDFTEVLDANYDTIFDKFENGSFFDNEEDPIRKFVLRDTPKEKDLEDMEPPFVYIERAMEAHEPYNQIKHGNNLDNGLKGNKYVESLNSDKEIKKAYNKGAEGVFNHFIEHIQTLKDEGLYEDTLIVLTSDHGELLGERINGRKRYLHTHPMSQALVEVPTLFMNASVEEEKMRLIDIPETCLNILDKEGLKEDGENILESSPKEGKVLIDGYASYNTDWRYSDGEWTPKNPFKLKKDILEQDLKIFIDSLKSSKDYQENKGSDSMNDEILEDLDI